MNQPSKLDDWKSFEKINPATDLNILFTKGKEILPAYISNHNSIHEKQIIFIDNSKRRKRLALSCSKKKFSIIIPKHFKPSW